MSVSASFSVSRASRAPCARSLYEDPLYKMFVSGFLYEEPSGPGHCVRLCRVGSPYQGPVGPLAQDHCMRTLCARCLCRGFAYEESSGPLVQDLGMRIPCARNLCQDLCFRSLWGHLRKTSV